MRGTDRKGREREREKDGAKDYKGEGKDGGRRDVERDEAAEYARRNENEMERGRERGREKRSDKREEENHWWGGSEGRRRARTAVVNGNNCCGRCHSKARVPNARCQTVVRVITVITSYRDMYQRLRERERNRGRKRCILERHTRRDLHDSLCNLDSSTRHSTRGKYSGWMIVDVFENKLGGKPADLKVEHAWLHFSESLVLFRASLLETNVYYRDGQKTPWLNDPPSPVRTDNGRPARG